LECCELDPDFEALSLEQEQIMHQHYKDAMEKNLSIAHEKLNDLQDMTNRVSDNSLLPYALSMQVVEFIKIIYYLHRRETESNDEIYNTFLIKSLYALDRTVSKLKALPEEEDRASAGYFSGLMFSNWFSVEDKTPIIKAKDFKLTV
jgi:long-subunit acyl-CoA synthetase (AMP-forming)